MTQIYTWQLSIGSSSEFHRSVTERCMPSGGKDIYPVQPQWWRFHLAEARGIDESNILDIMPGLSRLKESLKEQRVTINSWALAVTMGKLVLLPLNGISELCALRREVSGYSNAGTPPEQPTPHDLDVPHICLAVGDPQALAAHSTMPLTGGSVESRLVVHELSLGILRSSMLPPLVTTLWSAELGTT